MPTIDFIENKEDLKIVVWNLQENLQNLEDLFQLKEDIFYQNLSEKRKKEFLGKTLCLDFLGVKEKIKYKENGKPVLENSKFVSISHSGDIICVATSKKPIGIDVEKNKPEKILSTQKKFIGNLEEKWLGKKENLANYLHLVWGAKESLYKIADQPGTIWKQQMQVDEFLIDDYCGHFVCWIEKGSKFVKHQAHYKIYKDYFLVWVVGID